MTIPNEPLLILFTSLFAIFCLPAAIGPIATISGGYPRSVQRRIAIRVAAAYGRVLIVSAWVGQWLLEILGVTMSRLTVAGLRCQEIIVCGQKVRRRNAVGIVD